MAETYAYKRFLPPAAVDDVPFMESVMEGAREQLIRYAGRDSMVLTGDVTVTMEGAVMVETGDDEGMTPVGTKAAQGMLGLDHEPEPEGYLVRWETQAAPDERERVKAAAEVAPIHKDDPASCVLALRAVLRNAAAAANADIDPDTVRLLPDAPIPLYDYLVSIPGHPPIGQHGYFEDAVRAGADPGDPVSWYVFGDGVVIPRAVEDAPVQARWHDDKVANTVDVPESVQAVGGTVSVKHLLDTEDVTVTTFDEDWEPINHVMYVPITDDEVQVEVIEGTVHINICRDADVEPV